MSWQKKVKKVKGSSGFNRKNGEGLLMMGTGIRYRFFIPPDLAWGRKGAGSKIGPWSVLIIDARLVEVV